MDTPKIYTIGHSTHQLDFFLALLQLAGVNCVVDVRSIPASARNPQYNQHALTRFLKDNGIAYLHFAQEFGARQTDAALLDNDGRLDFPKVRAGAMFKRGIARIGQGIGMNYRIALMCSECNPLDCHRFSMVSIGLEHAGFEVNHILKNQTIITNRELEQELLRQYDKKIAHNNLFDADISLEMQLEEALHLKNKEIGFMPSQSFIQEEND
jgi:uncharacterized protein (DUF488 family)